MILLDGKLVSAHFKTEIASRAKELKEKQGLTPHLAAILVGNDGASETYVASKVKNCEEVGFRSTLIRYDNSVSEKELLSKVEEINNDPLIHGLIVQLPLPDHISVEKITETISHKKDVDGFHPINVGRMAKGLPSFISATPYGILKLLEYYKIETSGKHCVVIGRSHIVGSPISILMARNTFPGNSTVTLTHSKTKNLKEVTRQADIIIAALGKPEFLTAEMVKDGAVIIDVASHVYLMQVKSRVLH
jgi:methylenetetrahydrofolate dehydrogenase (NADP+) / methenyltetrahydrofolate cyclohydrolase